MSIMNAPSHILVIGEGKSALESASGLIEQGAEVIVSTRQDRTDFFSGISDRARILKPSRVETCSGCIGDFQLGIKQNKSSLSRNVAGIVIAEECVRKPDFASLGLTPSETVISLSQCRQALSEEKGALFEKRKRVTFFHSLFSESHPFILAEVLSCAKTLQTEYDTEAFVFVSNLKVAQNGLEEQYQDCREAGVVFVKFQKSAPRIRQKADGNVEIEFYDEFIRETFLLKADVTVADEIVFPSPELERLSKILSIDTDAYGFAQTENVLRVGGRTNREGIFVVGPSAGPCSEETVFIDAANAVLNSLEVPGRIQTPITDVPEIDERCIRCLTCYRLCPYGAVALNTKVFIQPFACQKCGICVVECPRGAIHMKQTEQVRPTPKTGEKENAPFAPAIVAFCCSRSAARAAKVAGFKNLLPSGKIELKEVPCAGAISPGVILREFTGGADGVLVLSCHRDNCHSETGNLLAESRVERIGRFFEETGLDSGRLWMKTLASNMDYEFSDICKRFGEQIVKLGPLGGSTA